MTSSRVVVTGMGTLNPLGGDLPSTWRAVRAGTCAVRALPEEWSEGMDIPVRIGAPVAVEPGELLSVREMRRLDRASQHALLAAREAWAQAFPAPGSAAETDHMSAPALSLDHADVDPTRVAVCLSPGMGMIRTVMDTWDTLRERGARRVSPVAVPALMPNAAAAVVGIELGARAGVHAPMSACASGAEALALACDLIEAGRADVVVAGGTEATLTPMGVSAFAAMRALSRRNDDPAGACRPFAADRDGFVMGEGAGVLVLEREEHARARGAHVLAVLAGAGISADAFDVVRPNPSGEGQERAVRQALERAGAQSADVAYVNAHATSTPAGDAVEAGMLARTLPGVSVSATKSLTGHLLGGAGALEAILTVCSLRDAWAAPTAQPGGVDPEIAALDLTIVGPQGADLPALADGALAVSTSFGFGGHNVALAFTRGHD